MWKFRIEIFTRCGGSHSGSRRLLVVVVVTVHVLVVVIYILVFVFLIPYRPVAATRTVQCLVTEQRSAVGRRRQLRLQYLPSENDGFNENFFSLTFFRIFDFFRPENGTIPSTFYFFCSHSGVLGLFSGLLILDFNMFRARAPLRARVS